MRYPDAPANIKGDRIFGPGAMNELEAKLRAKLKPFPKLKTGFQKKLRVRQTLMYKEAQNYINNGDEELPKVVYLR